MERKKTRQHASSKQIVEFLRHLEAALNDTQQREKTGQKGLVRAKQSEAVAIERAHRHAERTRDAAVRENRLEEQRQRL